MTDYFDNAEIKVNIVPGRKPNNDNFADRIILDPAGGIIEDSTTRDATFEVDEPNGWSGSDYNQSVWFSFTPTTTGRYKFRFDNFAADGYAGGWAVLGLRVYTGAALNSLTSQLGSTLVNNEPYASNRAYYLTLTSGTEYIFKVYSPAYNTGSATFNKRTGKFAFEWAPAPNSGTPPANDDVADAIDLGNDPATSFTVDTRAATNEGWEGAPASLTYWPNTWYRFHSTLTGDVTIIISDRTDGDAEFVPYLAMYELLAEPVDDWADLDWIQDVGQPGGGEESNTFAVEAGKDYVIEINDWYYYGAVGEFDVTIQGPPPPNDNYEDKENLHQTNVWDNVWWWTYSEAGQRAGTTEGGTFEVTPAVAFNERAHAGYGPTRSVWYALSFNTDPAQNAQVKIWVESAVDCVMAVYNWVSAFGDYPQLSDLVAEDDDSGPGNQPEVTVPANWNIDYVIAVDSKTPGDFVIKWEMLPNGTPPANDDFADAPEYTDFFQVSGTTVGATAEVEEPIQFGEGIGATDSVWYKFVAPRTMAVQLKGRCDSNNNDGYIVGDVWKGTTLANLQKATTDRENVMLWAYYGEPLGDEPWGQTHFDVVQGETYYIRIMTYSGGSEDFTISVDEHMVYLNLQVSGDEEMHGTLLDEAEIYLKHTVTFVEDFHEQNPTDAATVYYDIQPSGVDLPGVQTTDAATVYLDLQPLGGECYSRFHFTGEGEADLRWVGIRDEARWSGDDDLRWAVTIEVQPGCH